MGIITDNFSINGSKKRSYLYIICIVESLAYGSVIYFVEY